MTGQEEKLRQEIASWLEAENFKAPPWGFLQSRFDAPKVRKPVRIPVLAACAVVCAAALAAWIGGVSTDISQIQPSAQPHVQEIVGNLGGAKVSALAVSPSAVWMAVWDRGILTRVDKASGKVTSVKVGSPNAGIIAVTRAAGQLFLYDYATQSLMRADQDTMQIQRRWPMHLQAIAGDAQHLLVVRCCDGLKPGSKEVLLLSPDTGAVLSSAVIEGEGEAVTLRIAGSQALVGVEGGAIYQFDMDPLSESKTANVPSLEGTNNLPTLAGSYDGFWSFFAAGRPQLVHYASNGEAHGTSPLPTLASAEANAQALAVSRAGIGILSASGLDYIDRSGAMVLEHVRLSSASVIADDNDDFWIVDGVRLLLYRP